MHSPLRFQIGTNPSLPTDVESPRLTPLKAILIGLGTVTLLITLAVLDTRAAAEQERDDPDADPNSFFGGSARRRRRRQGRRRRNSRGLGDIGVVTPEYKEDGKWYTTSKRIPESTREALYMHERDIPSDPREAFERGFEVGRDGAEWDPEVRQASFRLVASMIKDDPERFDKEGAIVRDIVEQDEDALKELCKGDETALKELRRQLIEEPDDDFLNAIMDDRRDPQTGENRGSDWDRAFEGKQDAWSEAEREYFYQNLDREDCRGYIEDAEKDKDEEKEKEVEEAREEEQKKAIEDPPDELIETVFDDDSDRANAWTDALEQYVTEHGGGKELTADEKYQRGVATGRRESRREIKKLKKHAEERRAHVERRAYDLSWRHFQKQTRERMNERFNALGKLLTDAHAAYDRGDCVQTANAVREAEATIMMIDAQEAGVHIPGTVRADTERLRGQLNRSCVLAMRRDMPQGPEREYPREEHDPAARFRRLEVLEPPDRPVPTEAPSGRYARLEVDGARRGRKAKRKRCYRGVCQ